MLFVISVIVIVEVFGVEMTTLSKPQLSVPAEVHIGIIQRNCVLDVCAANGIGITFLFQILTS